MGRGWRAGRLSRTYHWSRRRESGISWQRGRPTGAPLEDNLVTWVLGPLQNHGGLRLVEMAHVIGKVVDAQPQVPCGTDDQPEGDLEPGEVRDALWEIQDEAQRHEHAKAAEERDRRRDLEGQQGPKHLEEARENKPLKLCNDWGTFAELEDVGKWSSTERDLGDLEALLHNLRVVRTHDKALASGVDHENG